jgi:hypothetical protein
MAPEKKEDDVVRNGFIVLLLVVSIVLLIIPLTQHAGGDTAAVHLLRSKAAANISSLTKVSLHDRAVNAVSPGLLLRHHPIFLTVKPFSHVVDSAWIYDFLGMRTAVPRFCNSVYLPQALAHALRVDACNRQKWDVSQRNYFGVKIVQESYPLVGEEYFEYISTLKAVAAYPAGSGRPFAMVEVGAGYCHWTVSALLAAKHVHGESVPLVSRSIDGGDLQIESCKQHLADNGLTGVAEAFTAALTDGKTPTVRFSNRDNFGAGVMYGGNGGFDVRTIAIPELIQGLGVVDFFDIDIQGGESVVFADAANFDALDKQIKYIHIGTHGKGAGETRAAVDPDLRLGNELESEIVGFFEARGWERVFMYPRTSPDCWNDVSSQFIADTEMGPVCFADGAMAWVNPKLVGK